MPLTVVSSPADSSERTSSGASAAVISPASTRAWMQAPNPPGAKVFALALFGDIGLMRRRALDGVLAQLVRRAERVEDDARIGQQMLAPFLLQAERIGKDRQRIGFRQIGDGVKTSPLQQSVDGSGGGRGKAVADLLQGGRRQHLAQHRAGAGVRRRIRLEDDAWRTPRLFLGEIA